MVTENKSLKYRDYEYKCRRCSEIYNEMDRHKAEFVYDHISAIAIQNVDKLDLILFSIHECEDGGLGIGDLVGCSAEWEEM